MGKTNGNLKMGWLIGVLIPVVFGLLGLLYTNAMAYQKDRDAQQDKQIQAQIDITTTVAKSLSDISLRLGRIEGKLSLPNILK